MKGPPGVTTCSYLASKDRVLRPAYRVTATGSSRKGYQLIGEVQPSKARVSTGRYLTPAATPVRRIRLEAQLNIGQIS